MKKKNRKKPNILDAQKIENTKNIEQKNNEENRTPLFFLIGILILVGISIIFYIIALRYSPVNILSYSGYGIEPKIIAKNLKSENFANTQNVLPLVKLEEQETIYKKLNSYYVGGDEKKKIDINYPIYINEKSALLNISEKTKFVTSNYEQIEGYENSILAEGQLYNAYDLSKADNNKYNFVKVESGIYTAIKDINIKTLQEEYTIPTNSIIYFTENYITYYELKGEQLVYNNILCIDKTSTITIAENEEITYEKFLISLGEKEEAKPIIPSQNETQEPEEEENKTHKPEEPTKEEPTEEKYIKPEITAEKFEVKVYTAKTKIKILDPQGRILSAMFVIKKNNKTYQRRLITGSGELEITGLSPDTEFEIEGTYSYYNEEMQKVEETFYKEKIKTETIDKLGKIYITHTPGKIYSNKIELTNFGIENDINEEVIKGIAKIEIEIDGITYKLSNKQINSIKNKEKIIYETGKTVESNKTIKYKINIYDKSGNKLKVENEEGKTRTSKEAPTVRVKLKKQEVNEVVIEATLRNQDKANLKNLRYVILEGSVETAEYRVQETLVDKTNSKEKKYTITSTDLDPNSYYTIRFYVDYDLEDEQGEQKDVLITEETFTTMPLESLGQFYWNTEIKELESNRVLLNISIDEIKTDKRLIQIINESFLKVVDPEGTEILKVKLNKEQIKNAEILENEISDLKSNTEYYFTIETTVKQGSIEAYINQEQTLNSFITKKKPAKILIRNQFVTGEIIDFDVKVEDIDSAILTGKVRVEMRDEKNNLVALEELKSNGEYERKQYNKLEAEKIYTITYIAEQYNEGNSNNTYVANYVLEKREIITRTGITGQLQLYGVNKKGTGKNLINVASKIHWLSRCLLGSGANYGMEYNEDTKVLQIGNTTNNSRMFVYDLKEYAGQTVTISFKAKAIKRRDYAYDFCILNGKEYDRTTLTKRATKIENLSENEYKEYKYTLNIESEGYLGFFVYADNELYVKDLQVELGSTKTGYEEFKYQKELTVGVNLEDKNNEIVTKDYYLRLYENNNLITEQHYEEITEDGLVENAIKTFQNITDGTKCKIELAVKIRDRYYTLDYYELEIKRDEEIKAISSKAEYREIRAIWTLYSCK